MYEVTTQGPLTLIKPVNQEMSAGAVVINPLKNSGTIYWSKWLLIFINI